MKLRRSLLLLSAGILAVTLFLHHQQSHRLFSLSSQRTQRIQQDIHRKIVKDWIESQRWKFEAYSENLLNDPRLTQSIANVEKRILKNFSERFSSQEKQSWIDFVSRTEPTTVLENHDWHKRLGLSTADKKRSGVFVGNETIRILSVTPLSFQGKHVGAIIMGTDLTPSFWKHFSEVSGLQVTLKTQTESSDIPLLEAFTQTGSLPLFTSITDPSLEQLAKESHEAMYWIGALALASLGLLLFFTFDFGFLSKLKKRIDSIGEQTAQVGHDLHSPLAALEGELFGELKTMAPTKRRRIAIYLDRIRDILGSLSPSGPSSESPSQCLLAPLIQKVVEEKQSQFPGVSIDCESLETNLKSNIDSSAFQRMLANLIDNAIESHSKSRAEVTLRLSSKSDRVLLTVGDRGCGVPPSQRHQVFKRGVSLKPEGTGLGLWYAQQLMQRWNGVITLEARARGGTRVWIDLPRT